MFALIDREHMTLLAVYHDRQPLNDLWFIQHTDVATVLLEIAPGPLQTFTFLELQLLTRNMCGDCSPTKAYSNLVSDLVAMLLAAPPKERMNPMHLAMQAKWIQDNDPDREHEWCYAPNSSHPNRGLWEGAPVRCNPAPPDTPVLGKFAHSPASWPTVVNSDTIRTTALPEPVAGEGGVLGTNPAPRVPRAPAAPREPGQPRGSVSTIIWQVADQMWEAAGKPTDKSVVLRLRKDIMTTLESEHAVKRNSASNELGNWQKARIN